MGSGLLVLAGLIVLVHGVSAPAMAHDIVVPAGMPPAFDDVTFDVGFPLPGGRGAPAYESACWADEDRDGRLDLVLGKEDGDATTFLNRPDRWVRLEAKDGGASEPSRCSARPSSWSADLDGDARPDHVILRADPPCLLVLASARDGSHPVCGLGQVIDVALADLDNDGWIDALVSTAGGPGTLAPDGGLVVLSNNGRGDLAPTTSFDALSLDLWAHLPGASSIATADFDRDGATDAAVLTRDGGVRILRNSGANGNFVELWIDPGREARVVVEAKERRWEQAAAPGAQPRVLRLGVGDAAQLDRVEVFWAGADAPEVATNLRANAAYAIAPGEPPERVRTAPLLLDVEAPGRLSTGEAGAFRATLTTDGPASEIRWEFGDGAWSAGAASSHAYERADRYFVRAHAFAPDGGHDARMIQLLVGEPELRETPFVPLPLLLLGAIGALVGRRRMFPAMSQDA